MLWFYSLSADKRYYTRPMVPLHGIGCHGLVREFQAQRVLRQLAEFSDVPHRLASPMASLNSCIFQ